MNGLTQSSYRFGLRTGGALAQSPCAPRAECYWSKQTLNPGEKKFRGSRQGRSGSAAEVMFEQRAFTKQTPQTQLSTVWSSQSHVAS